MKHNTVATILITRKLNVFVCMTAPSTSALAGFGFYLNMGMRAVSVCFRRNHPHLLPVISEFLSAIKAHNVGPCFRSCGKTPLARFECLREADVLVPTAK